MGGIGSGHRWRCSRNLTDNYRSIDVRRWHRDTLLGPGQSFNWQWSLDGKVVAFISVHVEQNRVVLAYRHRVDRAEWTDECYSVLLDWTACHLGGRRPWFICPARGCGRRVAILYVDAIFACRSCYRLAYPSQRDNDPALRRAEGIRERLGWMPGILNGHGSKPKGMHWATFERLTAKHDAFVAESRALTSRRFGIDFY